MHTSVDTSDILMTLLYLFCLILANRSLWADRLLRCLYKLALAHYCLGFILLSLLDWQCSYHIYTDDEDDDNKNDDDGDDNNNNNNNNTALHQQRIRHKQGKTQRHLGIEKSECINFNKYQKYWKRNTSWA